MIAAGRSEGRGARALPLPRALADFLRRTLMAERERWALWCPVAFGFGIALYFAWPAEPWIGIGPLFAIPLLALAFLARRSGRAPLPAALCLPLGLIAAGFADAQIEAWRAAAPILQHRLGPVPVAGRVTGIDILPNGQRVTLAIDSLADWPRARLPRLVRLRVDPATPPLAIGDDIAATAMLLPPPPPDLPGDYDFQRQAYFQGLGAVGYTLGTIVDRPHEDGALWIGRLRLAMTRRIEAALPGTPGAVAAALITGEKGTIPTATAQDFRDAGLAHILVIAGLHMSLVTGCAFFLLRGGLALVPRIALRHPIKKWAALAALLLAFLYLVISGAAVPTQRAFVMCALALAAILGDRLLMSLHGVAWAAMLVLALAPVALLGGSFQMSFAAVIGLIAFYETYGARFMALGFEAGPARRAALHMAGIALTTLVVTLGTAPFAIYHFDRFPVYSVLANVVAVPISAFWLMPWALVGCLLMPFGLETLGLIPMGWGIRAVMAIAHGTAGLPGDVAVLPAMPQWAIVAVALGGLWLAFWRQPWRLWGALPIVIGMASLALVRPPDIFVSADGRLAAFRDGGAYLLSTDRFGDFAAHSWMEQTSGAQAGLLPASGRIAFGGGTLDCADAFCRWRQNGHVIVLIRHRLWWGEACPEADMIIALIRLPPQCRGVAGIIDTDTARRDGARAIWIGRRITSRTTQAERGKRPWVSDAQ